MVICCFAVRHDIPSLFARFEIIGTTGIVYKSNLEALMQERVPRVSRVRSAQLMYMPLVWNSRAQSYVCREDRTRVYVYGYIYGRCTRPPSIVIFGSTIKCPWYTSLWAFLISFLAAPIIHCWHLGLLSHVFKCLRSPAELSTATWITPVSQ